MQRYLAIDEEGYVSLDGVRIEDEQAGAGLLKNLQRFENDRFVTTWEGADVFVEAFDEPLVARHVEKSGDRFVIVAPYGLKVDFRLEELCVDEWDRFHGLTENKISFVLSRQAQFEFFDLVDSFDDESVTVAGRRFEVPAYYIPLPEAENEKFWTNIYNTETPRWELGREAKPLADVLSQLKLTKSRVLVLGCGSGQDAAYLAKQGHVVTAVDFSGEAIQRAKAQFGDVPGLQFIQSDVFQLKLSGSFDLIFEHACFPAIPPQRREELVQIWKKHLVPRGHLLGIFFVMAKRGGPPFGNSEWEMRERLKKSFRFLYWTRWRQSLPLRMGRELVVYAQKLD